MSSAMAPSTDPPPPAWSSNPINSLPTSIPGQPGTTPTTTTPTTTTPTTSTPQGLQ
jgi:hypothetical protein